MGLLSSKVLKSSRNHKSPWLSRQRRYFRPVLHPYCPRLPLSSVMYCYSSVSSTFPLCFFPSCRSLPLSLTHILYSCPPLLIHPAILFSSLVYCALSVCVCVCLQRACRDWRIREFPAFTVDRTAVDFSLLSLNNIFSLSLPYL